MRKYKRQIARARLTVLGVGNVNRKMGNKRDGVPLWRAVLTGDFGKQALKAQCPNPKKQKKKGAA